MREIDVSLITEKIALLVQEVNYSLPKDILSAIRSTKESETNERAKGILSILIENSRIAREKQIPICQDTGLCLFFVELGEDVRVEGLYPAINSGVRKGYTEGYLRMSMAKSPLFRENTKDNTPAIIHTEIVSGDSLKIQLLIRGGGSENMSLLKMLGPTEKEEAITEAVLAHTREKACFVCPPLFIGIGIGGDSGKAVLLSKKAVLRGLVRNANERIAILEESLLEKVNQLGIGPAGLGGRTTALAVNIEEYPTHIGLFPIAITLSCCATRYGQIEV
ncbi:MAG: fumarate hydratase [bacterium]|nr:fumarate hydratase [bacterium]